MNYLMKNKSGCSGAYGGARTDLALESYDGMGGTEYAEETGDGGITVSRLRIVTRAAARRLGRPRGEYITVSTPRFAGLDDDGVAAAAEVVARELSSMASALLPDGFDSVMILGLGNREMTPDAVGPGAAERITATRHLAELAPDAFGSMGCRLISVFTPGVTGQTGIETASLVRAAVKTASPSLVVAVDALAARSCERLGCTVQISDSGISPGSGVGNDRQGIDRASVKVPVIAVGVPTVVNSSVLVSEALSEAGMLSDCRMPDALSAVLKRGESFFVTPRESDVITRIASRIISSAVEDAFVYGL